MYSPTVLLSPCGSWRIVNQEDAANAKGVRGVNSVLEQEKEVNENVYFLDVSRRLIMLYFDGTPASSMDGANRALVPIWRLRERTMARSFSFEWITL
ncbi:uncharacterized protein METZ01_LOCUS282686, partial [marine metagenome]